MRTLVLLSIGHPWALLGAAAGSLGVVALVVIVAAIRERRRGTPIRELALVVPDLVRLMLRLLRDRSLPAGVRWRLALAVAYNLQPINLIPDFVPVIGFVDNIAVTIWAVRSVVRRCGEESLERHWPGSPERLALVLRFAGGRNVRAEPLGP